MRIIKTWIFFKDLKIVFAVTLSVVQSILSFLCLFLMPNHTGVFLQINHLFQQYQNCLGILLSRRSLCLC